jgi:predicted RNA-binding Zn ribbon-like protein
MSDFLAQWRIVRDSGLRPRFGVRCLVEVEVPTRGFVASLGRIAAIVLDAVAAGTWSRLKACPEDDCNYAFYDRSKNRSRTWCAMARCGSRAKMRSYRARRMG